MTRTRKKHNAAFKAKVALARSRRRLASEGGGVLAIKRMTLGGRNGRIFCSPSDAMRGFGAGLRAPTR